MKTSNFLKSLKDLGMSVEHHIFSEINYYLQTHGDIDFPFPPLVLLADSEMPKLAWEVSCFESARKYYYKTPSEFMDKYRYLAS